MGFQTEYIGTLRTLSDFYPRMSGFELALHLPLRNIRFPTKFPASHHGFSCMLPSFLRSGSRRLPECLNWCQFNPISSIHPSVHPAYGTHHAISWIHDMLIPLQKSLSNCHPDSTVPWKWFEATKQHANGLHIDRKSLHQSKCSKAVITDEYVWKQLF